MQRHALAAIAVALVTVTAGCGFLLGNEALEFAANPVTVSDDAVSETGYEETAVRSENVSRNVTVADQRRTVRIVNHLGQYERQVDLPGLDGSQRAAVFLALSSPEIEVAGQTLNPIDSLDERELLGKFDSQYEGLSVGQRVDNRSVQALGANRTVEKFEGTATLAGNDVDVFVHVTTFQHDGGDHIAAIAIYPRAVDDQEQDNVDTLLSNLEHENSDEG